MRFLILIALFALVAVAAAQRGPNRGRGGPQQWGRRQGGPGGRQGGPGGRQGGPGGRQGGPGCNGGGGSEGRPWGPQPNATLPSNSTSTSTTTTTTSTTTTTTVAPTVTTD